MVGRVLVEREKGKRAQPHPFKTNRLTVYIAGRSEQGLHPPVGKSGLVVSVPAQANHLEGIGP